jgi:hypothetical protein
MGSRPSFIANRRAGFSRFLGNLTKIVQKLGGGEVLLFD